MKKFIDVKKYTAFRNLNLADSEKKAIQEAIGFYKEIKPKYLCRHIAKLKEGNVDFSSDLISRLEKILQLGRDSSTLNSYIIRYGETLGTLKHKEKTKQTSFDKKEPKKNMVKTL